MKNIKKFFGSVNMSWITVIIFAVVTGVYTGLINQVSILEGTSFRDIAVSYEWWVLFAVIIVVNCKKPIQAAFKCFVFFFISQPCVFWVEIPTLGFVKAIQYWQHWIPMIILTLPGGFIAYFCKKQNIPGAIILGIGNSIVAITGAGYIAAVYRSFPNHILTSIFCIAEIVVTTFCIYENKRERIFAFILPIIVYVGYFIL